MKFEKIQYIERKTGEIKTEKVMGEGALKFLYYNPFGKLALHTIVKRKFLSDWYGRKMSKPESKEKIKSFVEEMGIDMSEYKRPIEDYTSFNDFFYRELKDGARKIDYDENVIVSPADGKILAYQNIKEIDKFFVKGSEFTLEEFFNDKEKLLNNEELMIRDGKYEFKNSILKKDEYTYKKLTKLYIKDGVIAKELHDELFDIMKSQKHYFDSLAKVSPERKRLENPHSYKVDLSSDLINLKYGLINKIKNV